MSEEIKVNELEEVAGGNDGMGGYATTYKIVSGDTLTGIAKKFKVTLNALYNANAAVIKAEANKRGFYYKTDKEYMDHIWPGTVLTIPKK